jgi:YVTN family beta-propeller protein
VRRVPPAVLVPALALLVLAPAACAGDGASVSVAQPANITASAARDVVDTTVGARATLPATVPTTVAATPPTAPTSPPPSTALTAPPDGRSSADRRLGLVHVVTDPELQPKSVVHSGTGLFFAQNMMYRHNVSVYDRTGTKVATIPDTVDLARFGRAGGPTVQGSPVEAAFSPDGRHAFVSNYKMYGPGYHPVADDDCDRGAWDPSFVYRIDTTTFAIDAVIGVGAVPKYVAVAPDGRTLVVSNWCSFDVSIVDLATLTEVGRIDVGRHPRGIAITSDSRTAYVTVMGEARIVAIDLAALAAVDVPNAGSTPRHLVLSPDDRFLYVSSNLGGTVRKIDLAAGLVAGQVATGEQPRSMVLADDGASLYVVNYVDGTVSKVRTTDMAILQTEHSGVHPVGITYDAASRRVWVANYAGSLSIFQDA